MTRQDDHFEEFANSDAFIEALMLGDDPSACLLYTSPSPRDD